MRLALGLVGMASMLSWSGQLSARDLDLEPSSKWILQYSPEGCTLARSFGEGEETVVAQFVKTDIGAGFEFNLKGRPLEVWRNRPRIDVRFGNAGNFVSKSPIDILSENPLEPLAMRIDGRFDNFDTDRRNFSELTRKEKARLRQVEPAIASEVESVTIKGGDLTLNLLTGSMRAPAASLNKCSEELIASWGFDPQAVKRLALYPEPIGPLRELFKDLGPRYLRYRDQADLGFRMAVDEEGVPTNCTLLSAVGEPSIAAALCSHLMKRARFWPAETQDGTRVPAYYVASVLYYSW